MPNLGRLYVFEGLDGSGKTALARSFSQALRDREYRTNYFAFPGQVKRTLGWHVHRLHHDTRSVGIESIHPASLQILHIAAHIDGLDRGILPALNRGECVVLDRYWWSTWAYGVAAGVNRRALRLMIELELLHWNGIHPTSLFLIERDTTTRHGQDVAASTIWREYKGLARRERGKYRIHIIKNDGPLEETLRILCGKAEIESG